MLKYSKKNLSNKFSKCSPRGNNCINGNISLTYLFTIKKREKELVKLVVEQLSNNEMHSSEKKKPLDNNNREWK